MSNGEPSSKRRTQAIPPPGVAGMDIRTWLAGCALTNTELIPESTHPAKAAQIAHRIADALMLALNAPAAPTRIPKLSDEELIDWENAIATERMKNDRETVIEVKGGRQTILPPSTPRVPLSGSTGSTLPSRR